MKRRSLTGSRARGVVIDDMPEVPCPLEWRDEDYNRAAANGISAATVVRRRGITTGDAGAPVS